MNDPTESGEMIEARGRIQRRAWLLMLLDGAERSGVVPLENMRLHRFAFLANCLAPVYDLPAADGKILKYRRGPFYPELQWDVDRLAVQGLIRMHDLRHVIDEFGPWFSATYSLSNRGIEAVKFIADTPNNERIHRFLLELSSAFAALPDLSRDGAALEDATYADPLVVEGSLIDFGEWQIQNYSEGVARAFAHAVPAGVKLNRRDELHLYFRYLDRMVERRAG